MRLNATVIAKGLAWKTLEAEKKGERRIGRGAYRQPQASGAGNPKLEAIPAGQDARRQRGRTKRQRSKQRLHWVDVRKKRICAVDDRAEWRAGLVEKDVRHD